MPTSTLRDFKDLVALRDLVISSRHFLEVKGIREVQPELGHAEEMIFR